MVWFPEKIAKLRNLFYRNDVLVEGFANKQLARRMVDVLRGKELSFTDQSMSYGKNTKETIFKEDKVLVENFDSLIKKPYVAQMLSTRRDYSARTFLKALATITVVPAIIWSVVHKAKTGSFNFFQSNSEVVKEKVDKVLDRKDKPGLH